LLGFSVVISTFSQAGLNYVGPYKLMFNIIHGHRRATLTLWNLKNQVNHVISILKRISANYIETKREALIELGVTTKLKYFSKKTLTYSNIQKFQEKSEHQTKKKNYKHKLNRMNLYV
jgi:hypothetical protein